jgi:hypothetical protein
VCVCVCVCGGWGDDFGREGDLCFLPKERTIESRNLHLKDCFGF